MDVQFLVFIRKNPRGFVKRYFKTQKGAENCIKKLKLKNAEVCTIIFKEAAPCKGK